MWRVTFFGDEKEISDLIFGVMEAETELPYHYAEIETPNGKAALLPVTSEMCKELLGTQEQD